MNRLSTADITDGVPPFQSRHIHNLAFVCPIARTSQYNSIFLASYTIYLWNSLPDAVGHSQPLITF